MKEIFIKVCEKAIGLQNSDGSMPAGHNGPYYDPETPIRNTSHWVISFIKAYELTGEEKFSTAARDAIEFIYKNPEYWFGYTYLQRNKKGKDQVNGVIGTAWNIESFTEAYLLFKDEKYLEHAKFLFDQMAFSEKVGFWKIRNHTGELLNFDGTFNHQLWFCASGALLNRVLKDKSIESQLIIFFDKLLENMGTYTNGLVKQPSLFKIKKKKQGINGIKYYIKNILSGIKGVSLKTKEMGYHSFNIFAFALIFNSGFKHHFFDSDLFLRILKFTFTDEISKSYLINQDAKDSVRPKIYKKLDINRYAYPYNAPGFELPFISKVFKSFVDTSGIDLFQKQLELTFNPEENEFCNNTDDSATLTARIYEYSRSI